MKSLFSDLDQLIESAVSSATKSEKDLQKTQVKRVYKAGAKKEEKEKKEDMEEAEDEEKGDEESVPEEKDETGTEENPDKEEGGDESAKKITGAGSADETKPPMVPGTRTSKKLSDPPEKILRNPQFPDVAQKINTLRGGSSLKSKPISASVQEYLKTLTNAEKAALLTYLTNLSQIMAPVKKPDEVKDPSDVGIDVKFRGGAKKNQKSEKSPEKAAPEKQIQPSVGGVVVVGED